MSGVLVAAAVMSPGLFVYLVLYALPKAEQC